ncbi:DUF3800 domain-containing protein [Streptomyces xiamenensis]
MSRRSALSGSASGPRGLNVYIDETGDRGLSAKSSPFFAMTGLLVPFEDNWSVIATAAGLRAAVHASHPGATAPLHWVDHFKKKHPKRRSMAAIELASMPSAKVVHVIVPKDAIRSYPGLADGGRFYNYTTRYLLERVAWAAEQWEGGPRRAVVRLGAVKGMDHTETVSYLDRVRQGHHDKWRPPPWDRITWPPVWSGTDWNGIQLADLHAGLLNAALSGAYEDEACAANLLLVKHQLYRSPQGRLHGYGVKVMGPTGADSFVTDRCWWKKWEVA